MMLQLPIVAAQKSRLFRGRTVLNVSFSFLSNLVKEFVIDKLFRMYFSGSR